MLCEHCKENEAVNIIKFNNIKKNTCDKCKDEIIKQNINKQRESMMASSGFDFSENDEGESHGMQGVREERVNVFLEKFSENLTEMAKNGKLDPVIGRVKELERIQNILNRKTKNNPILIGPPGVGKSAVVEGLASLIVNGQVPSKLKNKKIYSLNINNIIAGTRYRGDFEERLQKIIEYVLNDDDIILFIDEIHNIVGAGSSEGSGDAANILKPYLSKGKIKCIGATTIDEYRKYIEKDSALERRFGPIYVEEPTLSETMDILMGLKENYEKYHMIKISDKAIEASVRLSNRYINDRYLPDKAIDLIDEACAKINLKELKRYEEIALEIGESMYKLKDLKEKNKENKKELIKINDDIKKYKDKIIEIRDHIKRIQDGEPEIYDIYVKQEHIEEVISIWTGIPISDLSENKKNKLLNLEDEYKKHVVGQEDAIKVLSDSIRVSVTDIKNPKLPIGSFILAGSSGVGKTHIAKITSKLIFNSEENILRIDMSEYMEKHSIAKLIGSPPGYVGHDDANQLCERIRKKPYQVILFDEIEKAHPDVFNLLLQLLDEGFLTDSHGRKVDFKNTIIFMTTNLGSPKKDSSSYGFCSYVSEKKEEYDRLKGNIINKLKAHFRPEFLNRIDDIVVFSMLTSDELIKIVDLLIKDVNNRLTNKGIIISLDEGVKKKIAKDGNSRMYGARPLRRAIKKIIETPIAMMMLNNELKNGDRLFISLNSDDEIKIDKEKG